MQIRLSEDGPEELRLTITGTPCEIEDLQMALVGFVKKWKVERKAKVVKPCGCQEEAKHAD